MHVSVALVGSLRSLREIVPATPEPDRHRTAFLGRKKAYLENAFVGTTVAEIRATMTYVAYNAIQRAEAHVLAWHMGSAIAEQHIADVRDISTQLVDKVCALHPAHSRLALAPPPPDVALRQRFLEEPHDRQAEAFESLFYLLSPAAKAQFAGFVFSISRDAFPGSMTHKVDAAEKVVCHLMGNQARESTRSLAVFGREVRALLQSKVTPYSELVAAMEHICLRTESGLLQQSVKKAIPLKITEASEAALRLGDKLRAACLPPPVSKLG